MFTGGKGVAPTGKKPAQPPPSEVKKKEQKEAQKPPEQKPAKAKGGDEYTSKPKPKPAPKPKPKGSLDLFSKGIDKSTGLFEEGDLPPEKLKSGELSTSPLASFDDEYMDPIGGLYPKEGGKKAKKGKQAKKAKKPKGEAKAAGLEPKAKGKKAVAPEGKKGAAGSESSAKGSGLTAQDILNMDPQYRSLVLNPKDYKEQILSITQDQIDDMTDEQVAWYNEAMGVITGKYIKSGTAEILTPKIEKK